MKTSKYFLRAKADYDEVYAAGKHSGKLELLKSSKYMYNAVGGNPIILNDVSNVEHIMDVSVNVGILEIGSLTGNDDFFNNYTYTPDGNTLRLERINAGSSFAYIEMFMNCEVGTYTFESNFKTDDSNASFIECTVKDFDDIVYEQKMITTSNNTNVSFSFYINRAGVYRLIIALPMNVDAGKYIEFANLTVFDSTLEQQKLFTKSKNLFAITEENYALINGASEINIVDSNNFSFTSGSTIPSQVHVGVSIHLTEGTYYISSDNIVTSNPKFKGGLGIYKGNAQLLYNANIEKIGNLFTITEDGTYNLYFYGAYGVDTNVVYTFPKIQIEKGAAKTEFQPFASAEYQINSNGTVDGVKSISPYMILETSNGMPIDCKYCRDIDRYIDNLER